MWTSEVFKYIIRKSYKGDKKDFQQIDFQLFWSNLTFILYDNVWLEFGESFVS